MLLSLELKILAERYVELTGTSLSRLSVMAGKHDKYFARIVRGENQHLGQAEQALRWFTENWPAGAPWPEGVRSLIRDAAE